jgi:serine-type D-Ala-D-Ala carboxypeptidase/endopeptidase (penicillin-binding protein 4)
MRMATWRALGLAVVGVGLVWVTASWALAQAGGAAAQPSAASPKRGEVVARLARLAAEPELKGLSCGLCVADLESGEIIFAHNAGTALIPASNMKLVTTSAALSALGSNWRFRTYVGTLGDDLVVVGGGDPNFSGRFWGEEATAAFRQWAKALQARGIK